MARIFISHSSKDNFESIAFRNWLISDEGAGYDPEDVFLDLFSLRPGENWRDALRAASQRCEAVILLASPASLASAEVRHEIILAEGYQKPILVGLLDGLDIGDYDDGRLTPYRHLQLVDFNAPPREVVQSITYLNEAREKETREVALNAVALARMKHRLDELGLEAVSFDWKPDNLETANPYPGLRGYREEDAGLFFGRDPDIAIGLSKLRALRKIDDGRALVIQAASGAGKSSFMRAGLWPRLRRDGDFEPIAIIRAAGGAISGPNGLARAIIAWRSAHEMPGGSLAGISNRLHGQPERAVEHLEHMLSEISARATAARRVANPAAAAPTLVIGVDQAEELFGAANSDESRQFMKLFMLLADRPEAPAANLVMTLRDDSIGTMLRASRDGVFPPTELMPLPPIPQVRFIRVIQEPAVVARQVGITLDIEPELTQRLIADSQGRDALPLLSVMLNQLFEDHRAGQRVKLQLSSYLEAGGVVGALSARLETARGNADYFELGAGSDETLRRLFIPNLAGWDLEASPPSAKRAVAREATLIQGDPKLEALADQLVESHLLTRSADDAGATLEVAHEALLRQPPISDWLEEDAEFLGWLEQVAEDRKDFKTGRRGYLADIELSIAQSFLAARRDDIPSEDAAFIEASTEAANKLAGREQRRSRQILISGVAMVIAALLMADVLSAFSVKITNRVIAPLYGYEESAPNNVALSTQSVAVILIDDEALRRLSWDYPIDYFSQYEMFSRIMQFDPKAIFVDLIYSYDRGQLASTMELLKDEATLTGTPIVFSDVAQTEGSQATGSHPSVSANFQTAVSTLQQDNSLYPLWKEALAPDQEGAAQASALQRETIFAPSVALTMIEIACGDSWTGREALAGCQDLPRIAAADPARADPMALRYGSLHQEAWQPLGSLVGLTGSEFREKAATLNDGCRHFPPDFSGRIGEASRQVAISILPLRRDVALTRCPYTLTVPLEQLMSDTRSMNDYLAEALKDKIVFVGASVVGAHNRVPILDTFGPGVFAHAMATDNLLLSGDRYLREPQGGLYITGPSGERWGLSAAFFLEIGVGLLFAVSIGALTPLTTSWIQSAEGRAHLRRAIVNLFWVLFLLLVAAASLAFAIVVLRWSSFNWIGALAYGVAARALIIIIEDSKPQKLIARLKPPRMPRLRSARLGLRR